jgi:hypothetical protein
MNTTLIVLAIVAIGAAAYFYLIASKKIEDKDGDFIPDVIEDKVKEVKTEVKKRATAVKKQAKDLKVVAELAVDELQDVVNAAKGTKKKPAAKKPAAKKAPVKKVVKK